MAEPEEEGPKGVRNIRSMFEGGKGTKTVRSDTLYNYNFSYKWNSAQCECVIHIIQGWVQYASV